MCGSWTGTSPVEALDSALSLVAAVSAPGDRSPTYFEAMTVAAFELFRRARVAVAVVEVGIGGRLDATNVLEPEVSVVTNVAADHLDVLGPALEDVAREKAGIFRRGQPALVGAEGTADGPRAVLHAEARRIGARLVEIPPAPHWEGLSPLAGAHQLRNVSLAVAAARAVAPLDDAAIVHGLAATRWRARLERIETPGPAAAPRGRRTQPGGRPRARGAPRRRLPFGEGGPPLRRDGRQGPRRGLRAARRARAPDRPRGPGVAAGRGRRGASPRALGRPGLETAPSVAEGLARLEAAGGAAPILVAGSLYLAGEVLALRG